MPELPEVETIRRGLEPLLIGATLREVQVDRPDLRFPFPDRFAERLEGAEVIEVGRRAKYLLFTLSTKMCWVTHLGMTGRFTIDVTDGERHEHMELKAVRPARSLRIGYSDPRRFGYMGLIPVDELEAHRWFARLGPEPLGAAFTSRYLLEAAQSRRQAIKTFLLDQRVVAGLGNIYVCEALYRAGIAPTQAAGNLTSPRIRRLVNEIREVLGEALAAGGSTLRDFANVEGGQGYFQHQFDVYGRESEPCLRSGCSGNIVRTVQSGRSTFYCPRCQSD